MVQFTDPTPTGTTAFQRSGVRTLDIAEGVLLGLRRGSGDSFTELVDVGRRYSLSPFVIAEALVAAASGNHGGRAGDPQAALIVEQQWGHLLRSAPGAAS
jgi:hypothetical protein